MKLTGGEQTFSRKARQKFALLGCLLLVACAPRQIYEGVELPPEETAVIAKQNDYVMLSFDERVFLDTRHHSYGAGIRSGAVRPGGHRLTAYHRRGDECRASGGGLIVLLLQVGCLTVTEDTHCAILDFVTEAGHEYKITAGENDTVLLMDDTTGVVAARANRIYMEGKERDVFEDACIARAGNNPNAAVARTQTDERRPAITAIASGKSSSNPVSQAKATTIDRGADQTITPTYVNIGPIDDETKNSVQKNIDENLETLSRELADLIERSRADVSFNQVLVGCDIDVTEVGIVGKDQNAVVATVTYTHNPGADSGISVCRVRETASDMILVSWDGTTAKPKSYVRAID